MAISLSTARVDSLVIGTYNTENYAMADRMVDGVYRKNYPKPEREKAALRAVMRALNADVLALQEIGSAAHLEELKRDLAGEGLVYAHSAIVEADDPDRHIALLSRVPLKSVRTHADLEFAYNKKREQVKRGLLEATFETTAGEITVFVVHLKSRFTDDRSDVQSALRRAGEADAIRARILERFPDPAKAAFFIVGDFNDTRDSKPLRCLHKKGELRICQMLKTFDPLQETWTYAQRKEDLYTRVDYILASAPAEALVEGGVAHIHDGKNVRDASDHRPLFVRLKVGAK